MSYLCAGRHRHVVGWSANRMASKSVLTIAGGAALWGLIVLATHFFWAPPQKGLLITPPREMADSATLPEQPSAGLLEVMHPGVRDGCVTSFWPKMLQVAHIQWMLKSSCVASEYSCAVQMCRGGGLLILGEPRQLVQLRCDFMPKMQLQRLQEHLLERWPLMTASELAAGYNALSIDLNDDGVTLSDLLSLHQAISSYMTDHALPMADKRLLLGWTALCRQM